METNKLGRGKSTKIAPNMHCVVVHLYNPPRQGASKGSKDFKTTHTFRGIKTFNAALEIINQFAESRTGGYTSYSMIKKAFYNGSLLVLNGDWIAKN